MLKNESKYLALVTFEAKSPNLDAMYIYKSLCHVIDVGYRLRYLTHE